jgi:hypothetical protein
MENSKTVPRKTSTLAVKNTSILSKVEQTKKASKAGRKSLSEEKKAKHRITLLLNDEELKTFTKKAGMIAHGTFLKHILVTETDLLK